MELKILFIKQSKDTFFDWPSLTSYQWPDKAIRVTIAEASASDENYQRTTISKYRSQNAIFIVIDPANFEHQKDNLKAWLANIATSEFCRATKLYFVVNATNLEENVKANIQNKVNGISTVLMNSANYDTAILYYDGKTEDIVSTENSINTVLQRDFPAYFNKSLPTKSLSIKPLLSLRTALELSLYTVLIFTATLFTTFLVGGLIGSMSGAWSDSFLSNIFDSATGFSLFVHTLLGVFEGTATPWGVGIVVTAFLVAALITGLVIGYEIYRRTQITPSGGPDSKSSTEAFAKEDIGEDYELQEFNSNMVPTVDNSGTEYSFGEGESYNNVFNSDDEYLSEEDTNQTDESSNELEGYINNKK